MNSVTDVYLKDRKKRQNVKSFASLMKTPVTGPVTLPADARIAIRSNAGCNAGTVAATVAHANPRTIMTPLLLPGGMVKLDKLPKASVVTPSVGFDVMVDTGIGIFAKIAGA